jgi:predicted anti-sigma-YlaC factor YlaD
VNTNTECERVRMALMASLDGESADRPAPEAEHLSTCSSCQHWLKDQQGLTGQLQGLSYPQAPVDLWAAVESRIHQPQQARLPRQLWLIVAIVLGWRALQLSVDLPIPVLHPLVPLVAALAALWLIAGDPLAIETSAPELQKRGI